VFRAEDIDILKDIPLKLRPPLVRVAGQFQNDGAGTFVIHVIKSVPPPPHQYPKIGLFGCRPS
jgi:hypothetical protein